MFPSLQRAFRRAWEWALEVFVQTAPQHHSARALSHAQAGLLSSRITCLLRLRGENLPVMTPCHRHCHPFGAAVSILSGAVGPSELKAGLQLHLGLLGPAFPAQQSRVRLCSRHVPGGCVCVELEKSWTPLWTSIINSHLKASWRRWAENHSLCSTLRILHLYVCVKTGTFTNGFVARGLN